MRRAPSNSPLVIKKGVFGHFWLLNAKKVSMLLKVILKLAE
jgi:hypothetical protein